MKIYKTAAILFIMAWSCALSACGQRPAVKTPNDAKATSAEAQAGRIVIAYEGEDGKTALVILKARARVRTTTSQMGELVEEINGVNNGNGYYLIYFVNGAKAKVGAGEYITKNGDRIEWKLIK
jgi:hypothetical protein